MFLSLQELQSIKASSSMPRGGMKKSGDISSLTPGLMPYPHQLPEHDICQVRGKGEGTELEWVSTPIYSWWQPGT